MDAIIEEEIATFREKNLSAIKYTKITEREPKNTWKNLDRRRFPLEIFRISARKYG